MHVKNAIYDTSSCLHFLWNPTVFVNKNTCKIVGPHKKHGIDGLLYIVFLTCSLMTMYFRLMMADLKTETQLCWTSHLMLF